MEIHIENRTAEVSLLNKEGNSVSICIDDKVYDVDIVMTENGACSIIHNGKSYNAGLIRKNSGKEYQVNVDFKSYAVTVFDTQAKYLRMKKSNKEKQNDQITAPMPGKVVKIPVSAGDRLNEGDTALVIEAMKMQSNYKVNADCFVKEILIQEGDAVNANQVLMTLDIITEDDNGEGTTL